MRELSYRRVNIFRGIISFSPDTAAELNLSDHKAWEEYIERHIGTLAQKNGIRPQDLQWAAAHHNERSHPHIHVVFWNKNQKTMLPYVSPKVPDSIRTVSYTHLDVYKRQILNQRIGVTRGMEEAMRGGSMFGFDKPIADPENYNEDGTMKRMDEYDRSFAERIRKQYPVGTKIILDEMNDPYRKDMVSGLRGIVDHVDDAAQIHCIWQNGSSLALIPGEDKFHIDAEQEQDIQPEEQSGELEL